MANDDDDPTTHDITVLLSRIDGGDAGAQDELMQHVYGHLRRVAQNRMSAERTGHTLEATELVHEAYLRLAGSDGEQPSWANRAHFYHAASEAMRRILIEHARKRGRKKRGGDLKRVASNVLDLAAAEENSDEILALDEAFQRLARKSHREKTLGVANS
jgi:RNA polymerase sigma factor (TIGR02999 family)